MRIHFILFSLLLGAVSAPAASLNDLYFGLDNMRGFAEVYWWFLSDGRVLQGLPAGLTPAHFEAACQASPASCGNYTLNGEKLAIKFRSGVTENWTFKTLNGGIQLNYLIMTPVTKYPAGARLNGGWSRPFSAKVHSAPGSDVTITSPTFYTFKPDGTFALKNLTGIDAESRVKGANVTSSLESQFAGTYSVHDNILMLVKNGKSEQHMIFPVAGDNLNIDGVVYIKQP
jgi:hypothetical protein